MKKQNLLKTLIYALLLAALAAVAFAGDFIDGEKFLKSLSFDGIALLRLALMIFGVLLIENIIVLILGAFNPKNHRTRSIISLVCSLAKYVAFIVILCWGLTIIGVNITAIIASIGVLALIVGFSAESLIADIVTGTFMLLENQYNVGDIVEVNGFRGIVTAIGIRTTCITDSGDNVKIVNNSEMKNILNRSDNSSKAVGDISIPMRPIFRSLKRRSRRSWQRSTRRTPTRSRVSRSTSAFRRWRPPAYCCALSSKSMKRTSSPPAGF